MCKKFFLLVLLALSPGFILSFGQPGGRNSFTSLTFPQSARISSMGGKLNAILDNDLALAGQNPALLNKSMHMHLSSNLVRFPAGIQYGYFSYSYHHKKYGSFASGFQYANYGSFKQADNTGNITGEFFAADYVFHLMWSHALPDSAFRIGISAKPLLSFYESYNSFALGFDIGITYNNPENRFTSTLLLKNIGRQFSSFSKKINEPLPFEIQMGLSHKLSHAPLRFSLVAQQLQNPDLTYDQPEEENTQVFGDETDNNSNEGFFSYADHLMRHIILGTELILTENLFFRIGYNYQQRQQLNIETNTFSTVGFSWGFGLKIKTFQVSYARSNYHLAGTPNFVSISTNLKETYNWGHKLF